MPMTQDELIKKYMREECCKRQAAWREWHCERQSQLVDDVKMLRREIGYLEFFMSRPTIRRLQAKRKDNKFQMIGDIYFDLRRGANLEQRPDVRTYCQVYGCSSALQSILDLQREEFDSLASFKLHWSWYRTQFRVFQFSATSFERLEAGDHVIVRVTGQLWLDLLYDSNKSRWKMTYCRKIMCPVLQQFEFEGDEKTVTRITSEVDLVRGMAARQGYSGSAHVTTALQHLSEAFQCGNYM